MEHKCPYCNIKIVPSWKFCSDKVCTYKHNKQHRDKFKRKQKIRLCTNNKG